MRGFVSVWILVFGLMPASCGEFRPPNVPFVPVDFTIFLFDPDFVNLQGVGGWVEVPGGSRGILVFRAGFNRFNAYELHCPWEQSGNCGRVSFDENQLFLECNTCPGESCASRFNPIDGSIVNGPTTYPLFQYRTQFDGQSMLRIFN